MVVASNRVPQPSASLSVSPLLSPAELQQWLEWAGQTLLAMGGARVGPRESSAHWPDYAIDPHLAYGYTGERLRPARPTSQSIGIMDEILALPTMLSDPTIRRILHSRALVTPIGNRYLYSWTRIAVLLHANRQAIRRWHTQGLTALAPKIPADKIATIRPLLSLPPLSA